MLRMVLNVSGVLVKAYTTILISLRSVSDFQISSEKMYALKNGGKYLLDVGDMEDLHWLVRFRSKFLIT